MNHKAVPIYKCCYVLDRSLVKFYKTLCYVIIKRYSRGVSFRASQYTVYVS